MAHTNAIIGHGTTITFGTGLMANIIDFDWSGVARAAIDSTHMGSGVNKSFIPGGTYDPGGLSTTIQFNNATAIAGHYPAGLMTAVAESCTVDFGAVKYSANAFATDEGVSGADEDVVTQAITLKFTAAIVATAS